MDKAVLRVVLNIAKVCDMLRCRKNGADDVRESPTKNMRFFAHHPGADILVYQSQTHGASGAVAS